MSIVCVSGGFDPLHIGHLEMFRDAARHGELVVILNSDGWLLRKKGFAFLPWEQRAAIIGDLRPVAHIEAVDDTDGTVCEALKRLKPRYFANGGDRKSNNTPESSLCAQLGIELLWNIGGGKADSSSDIARRAWVKRRWGQYVTLDEGDGYKVKKLMIAPGEGISLQYHRRRSEYWYVAAGEARVELDGARMTIGANALPVAVGQGMTHRLSNEISEPLIVIEIQSGDYLGEDDIQRIKEAIEA